MLVVLPCHFAPLLMLPRNIRGTRGAAWPRFECETVEVAIRDDGLIEISHREVLVASHVRLHPVEAEPAVWRRQPKARPARAQMVGRPVIRKVDTSGMSVSPGPTIGSAVPIGVNRSRCKWSATQWRSQPKGGCRLHRDLTWSV